VNVKEYISSGIIESYVLGLLSEDERAQFEAVCLQYPEVLDARILFEYSLEEQLLKDAKQLPPELKIEAERRILSTPGTYHTPESIRQVTPVRRLNAWKWVAAASLIIMAGSLYYAYRANEKYNESRQSIARIENERAAANAELTAMKREAEMMVKPGMKLASLKGTAHAQQASAMIFWDTASSKNVYLMISNLPQPSTDHQYQLWAMLNGTPTDLGLIDMNVGQKRLMIKMKNVQQAEAFAITLEPKGGSVQPTMDSMYVVGSL
jgi:anti-sigma-K factor RskA